MTNYKIITDFCSDLTLEMAEKLDVEIVPMEVVIDGEEPVSGFDIDISDFYTKLREKKNAQTSAANLDSFLNTFEKQLEFGGEYMDYIELESERLLFRKYKMEDMYISKIQEKTTVAKLKENLQTNAEINIYNKKRDLKSLFLVEFFCEITIYKDIYFFIIAGNSFYI